MSNLRNLKGVFDNDEEIFSIRCNSRVLIWETMNVFSQ